MTTPASPQSALFDTTIDPVEREFWHGTQQSELRLRYCNACQQPHWYPRPICPHCWHQSTRFEAASGLGTVYSMTRLHDRAGSVRWIGYITLDEGVTLLANLESEDTPPTIGGRVRARFRPDTDGRHLPTFVPCSSPA